MPVSAELGALAPVLERAGRPDPAERYDAGELARALMKAAERLPRPAPLPLVPTVTAPVDDQTILVPVPGVARAAIPAGAASIATNAAAPPPSRAPRR